MTEYIFTYEEFVKRLKKRAQKSSGNKYYIWESTLRDNYPLYNKLFYLPNVESLLLETDECFRHIYQPQLRSKYRNFLGDLFEIMTHPIKRGRYSTMDKLIDDLIEIMRDSRVEWYREVQF